VRVRLPATRCARDAYIPPFLRTQLAHVSERLQVLHMKLAGTDKEKTGLRHWAESDRREIRFVAHKSKEVELRERADRRDKRADSLEAEIAKLRKQIERLDEEEKQIRNQMLEP